VHCGLETHTILNFLKMMLLKRHLFDHSKWRWDVFLKRMMNEKTNTEKEWWKINKLSWNCDHLPKILVIDQHTKSLNNRTRILCLKFISNEGWRLQIWGFSIREHRTLSRRFISARFREFFTLLSISKEISHYSTNLERYSFDREEWYNNT
jgi:hypothetical protein